MGAARDRLKLGRDRDFRSPAFLQPRLAKELGDARVRILASGRADGCYGSTVQLSGPTDMDVHSVKFVDLFCIQTPCAEGSTIGR